MALFKLGKSDAARSEGGSARARRKKQAEEPQETLEVIRRRARNRLLGAALLVGVTVIGLPMLFDRQPRIVHVDAQVSIPDKGDVAPLQVPARESLDEREEFVPSAEAPAPVAMPLPDAPPQAAQAAADAREKERREQQAKAERGQREKQAKAEKERQQQQARAKAERERREQQAKAEKERKQQQAKAEKERKELQAKADKERREQQAKAEKERKDKEAARARALLEGKGAQPQQPQRFVIQLGAFADAQSVRQTRLKVERAGVKTYTQIIKNSAGEERTRVRAGPFTSRQDADKAAATLKGLGLPSAVQTL